MISQTVLIGCGDRGRAVMALLREQQQWSQRFTVVDPDPGCAEQAQTDGASAVVGSGWRLDILYSAAVDAAEQIVVAVADDAMALRITSVVRCLNETANIIAVVRHSSLAELIEYLGADHVITADDLDQFPELEHQDLLDCRDIDLAVGMRTVEEQEVGLSPAECGLEVLAVVREGVRLWTEDPAVATLKDDDRLLVLCDPL